MNYIGSKQKLLPFLSETMHAVIGTDFSQKIFCDIFAGTGCVGRAMKTSVRSVLANDCEYYGFVLNRNYIGNHRPLSGKEYFIEELNSLTPQKGFIFENYCRGGKTDRQYFSDENGARIDAVRAKIEEWRACGAIDDDMYFFLLCSLLEAADKVANTASVYGAYLKRLKKTAQKKIEILPADFEINSNEHRVFCENANTLIKKISGDILYLDPPYNSRQYGANYHLLNTIVGSADFAPQGKTGLRQYTRSKYCSVRTVAEEFEALLRDANFRYVFLSYNNEGLMSLSETREIMQEFGKYDLVQTRYQRFKADKTENRNHKADSTIEYLHILEKNG